MIATVTLNPSLDRLLEIDQLSADDANRVHLERHYPAGKGIDGSRVIHELGGETVAFGLVGGNNGLEVKLRLADEGVESELITIPGETRVNLLLYERATAKQYLINAQGPEATDAVVEQVLLRIRNRAPEAVIVAGSIPAGVRKDAYARLVRGLPETRVFVDADGEALALALAARPWAIKPNKHEAGRLLGRVVETEAQALAAVRELADTGIAHVLLSMGQAGALLGTGGQAWKGVPPTVKTVSAVGAGDSMVATYTLRILEGLAPPEAFRWALAAGAATALTPGTELCHKADVERLFAEAQVTPL
jgi:6-phosphofructokinase 2